VTVRSPALRCWRRERELVLAWWFDVGSPDLEEIDGALADQANDGCQWLINRQRGEAGSGPPARALTIRRRVVLSCP
jgi:hypothetical protein